MTQDDLDNELPEPMAHELNLAYQDINVILDPFKPVEGKMPKNVFETPEYWLLKGI